MSREELETLKIEITNLPNAYEYGLDISRGIEHGLKETMNRLEYTLIDKEKTYNQSEVDTLIKEELSGIIKSYGDWYDELSRQHEVTQKVPHTAFHQLIEERITELDRREK